MGWSVRAVLMLLAAVALSQESGAYPAPVDFDGSILRWSIGPDSAPITYEVKAERDEDALALTPAVDEAAALWTDVAKSYFVYAPVEEGQTADVTVHLRSTLDGSAYSAGYAIFDEYDGKTPRHCSIYVVTDPGLSYHSMAKTFLHELGHCLGLGHTLIPEAIMSYSLDKNTFALDLDDEAAIARLYPADGSRPSLPPGCAVGAATQRAPRGVLALVVMLPALAAGVRGFASRRVRFRASSRP